MSEVIYEKQNNEYGEFQPRNVVRLSVSGGDSQYENLNTLHVKQDQILVTLIRFQENMESVSLELSDAEVDALIEARTVFKASCHLHKQREEERIANEVVEARGLLEAVRNENRQWSLTLQSGGYYMLEDEQAEHNGHLIYRMQPHQVLKSVKEFLVRKNLRAPESSSPVDDYDPFIDSDDLP